MQSILIDLATATNVLTTTLNIVLVAVNLAILNRLQNGVSVYPPGTTSPNFFARLNRGLDDDTAKSSEKIPVRAASESKAVEREQLRRDAQEIENNAEIAAITDNY